MCIYVHVSVCVRVHHRDAVLYSGPQLIPHVGLSIIYDRRVIVAAVVVFTLQAGER